MRRKAHRTLVGIAAAVMIAAPAAQAMPIDAVQNSRPAQMRPSSSAATGLEYGDLRRELGTSSLAGTTSPPPRPAIEPAPASGGFDWLAVAIGAIVAAALALASWTALGIRRTARA
jgi:hypothetical protein